MNIWPIFHIWNRRKTSDKTSQHREVFHVYFFFCLRRKTYDLLFIFIFQKVFYNYFENFLLLQGYPLITLKYSALMQEYRTWFIKFEIQDFKFGHIIYNWNILGLNSLSFWSTNTNTSCTSCTTFIFFEECWLKF